MLLKSKSEQYLSQEYFSSVHVLVFDNRRGYVRLSWAQGTKEVLYDNLL